MHQLIEAVRDSNYRIFVVGNAFSLTGSWMQRVAVGWLAWDMTASGTWLGLIAFADLFPAFILAPLGGAIADRWDRLRAMQICQFTSFGLAGTLALLISAGRLNIWLLFCFVLTLGAVYAIVMPMRMSIVSFLVSRQVLGSAVALNSISVNMARFIGPAIAGFFIAYFEVEGALAASAFFYLVFALSIFFITERNIPAETGQRASMFRDMIDGLLYTIRHRGIFPLLALVVAMGLGARPVVELLPGFVSAIFAAGPASLATLTSSIGLGAIIGGLLMAFGRTGAKPVTLILASSSILAVAVLAFAAAPGMAFAVPVAFVVGFSMVISGIAIQTSIQLASDEGVIGRVLSAYAMVFRGSPAVGALVVGSLSEAVGLRLATATGCIILIVSLVILIARHDQLHRSLSRRHE